MADGSTRWRSASRCTARGSTVAFAALGAVEENPGGEVVAETLEAVDLARGGKQDIPGAELDPQIAVDELAAAADDHVDLVSRVRLLGVFTSRREDLRHEAPVLEHLGGRLAAWRREARNGLG